MMDASRTSVSFSNRRRFLLLLIKILDAGGPVRPGSANIIMKR